MSEDTRPIFVEFHVLRSFPPSNLNRDDLGSPKTAIFGGERRLRISSQCLKRTWRTSTEMTGAFADQELGVRTAQLPTEVLDGLTKADVKPPFEESEKEGLMALLEMIGRKKAKAKDESDEPEDEQRGPTTAAQTREKASADETSEEREQEREAVLVETAHLLYLSRQEIRCVVEFAQKNRQELKAVYTSGNGNRKDSKKKDSKKLENLRKSFADYMSKNTRRNAVDIGLFGRFITSDEIDTIDGALHVAHGLGTQKLEIEYDYFTAVDDLKKTAGAGHIGESEFASSVMYLYAVCDLHQLHENLGVRSADGGKTNIDAAAKTLAKRSVGALAKAMVCSTPTGKRTGTAPYCPAEFLEVAIRRGQPLSYANAFTSSVKAKDGDVMDASIRKLLQHRTDLEKAFDVGPETRFVLSIRKTGEGDYKTLKDLTNAVEKRLAELTEI